MFYAETRPAVLWTGKIICGRVLIWVDGSGRVSLQYVGLLRVLYNATFAVAARTRKVSRRPSTCPLNQYFLTFCDQLVGYKFHPTLFLFIYYYVIFTQELYPISAQHCSPWGSCNLVLFIVNYYISFVCFDIDVFYSKGMPWIVHMFYTVV